MFEKIRDNFQEALRQVRGVKEDHELAERFDVAVSTINRWSEGETFPLPGVMCTITEEINNEILD